MFFAVKGIYDNGKIEFLEPVPDMEKTTVVVLFESESGIQTARISNAPGSFSSLRAFGMWKNQKDIKDDSEFARQLRDQWDRANQRRHE